MDAANLLKPMLARGELHCIGATTLDEYRKHIEKDAALERRFQPVFVDEPSVEDTISILRGLRERYEVHHGVRITDSRPGGRRRALQPLHHRPLPARQGDRPGRRGRLPAAHGDRLDAGRARRDRAAPACSSRSSARRCARRRTPPRKERLEALEQELADLHERGDALKAQWEREKEIVHGSRQTREEQERLSRRSRPPSARARLRSAPPSCSTASCRELETAARRAGGAAARAQADRLGAAQGGGGRRGHRRVVSRWTGIPVSRLLEGEMEKLIQMEERLHARVIGQDEAVTAVADAVRRARAGLKDPSGPSARSSSSGPPASARRSWPARWPSSCSTTRTRWCAST